MSLPIATDCLAGTKPTIPGLLSYRDPTYFWNRCSELNRISTTALDGSIVVHGDSVGDYFSGPALCDGVVNFCISGNGFRNILNQMEQPIAHRAGATIILGGTWNTIVEETAVIAPEWVMPDIDYNLNLMANWLSGKGVFVQQWPIYDNVSPGLTAANMAQVNGYVVNHFGSKPGWTVLDLTQTFSPGGTMLAQYAELTNGVPNGHLNAAGWAILLPALRSALASVGALPG